MNSEKKAYIIRLIANFPQSHENIKRAYKISTLTYNKLKKVDEYSHCSDALIVQDNPEWRLIGKTAHNFIAKFLYQPQHSRIIQKTREAVKNELGEIYNAHILRKYVKKWLRYSFKKAWSRPSKYAASATKMSKGWFSAELLKMVHKEQLIFSVDEWSFTRAVKAEYS